MIVELPNWKIKRKTKTPCDMRNALNKNASEYIASCLENTKKRRESDKKSERPQSAVNKFSYSPKRLKVKIKKNTEVPRTPLNGLDTPVGLVVIEQFRRGLLKEVERFSGELTPARLEMIRNSSVQKEFLDMDVFQEHRQRVKLKKEMLSRSPLDNAIYMLRAMSRRERKSVVRELYNSIPEGTRFTKCTRLLR
jgi:hypothetical protein